LAKVVASFTVSFSQILLKSSVQLSFLPGIMGDLKHQVDQGIKQVNQLADQAIDSIKDNVQQISEHPTKLVDMGAGMAGGMAGATAGEVIGGTVGAVLGPVGAIAGAQVGGLVGDVLAGYEVSHLSHQMLHPGEQKPEKPNELHEIEAAFENKSLEQAGKTLGEVAGDFVDNGLLGGITGNMGKAIGSQVGKFAGKFAPKDFLHHHQEAASTEAADRKTD
jgi:uncharacterized membrane protein